MSAVWLLLYLACLARRLTIYRLDARDPATLVLLSPLLLLPALDWLCRKQPWLLHRSLLRVAGVLSLLCAVLTAQSIGTGFWDTRHLGVATLCAGMGLGLALVAKAHPRLDRGPAIWLWIAFWEYAGSWLPVLTILGAGLTACLGGFDLWPEETPAETPSGKPLQPMLPLVLLGLSLPKPWLDFQTEGGWATALAVLALGVGVAQVAAVRRQLGRLPAWAPLTALALCLFLYPTAHVPLWGAAVGLCFGALWPRLPRPLSLGRLSAGLLMGMVVSFALHSNLRHATLRHLLWWGS